MQSSSDAGDQPERRRHGRVEANLVVSYRRGGSPDDFEMTQSRNVGPGGILLITDKGFTRGERLDMRVRFPFDNGDRQVLGEVAKCVRIVKDSLYFTRVRFIDLDEESVARLAELVRDGGA